MPTFSFIRDAYLKAVPDILRELKIRADQGLSQKEVTQRLHQAGFNILPEARSENPWRIFIHRFKDPLVLLLILAAGISFLLNKYGDAVIIGIAIVLDSLLTFVQVWRTERTLEKIREYITHKALVLRDGVFRRVDTQELVPGDIIEFRAGERIPADARLIEVNGLSVQEASLTGESEDVLKSTTRLMSRTPLANRLNMVYMGTVVVNGTGRAVVISTGIRTEYGRIAQFLKTENSPISPLQRKLKKASLTIGAIIVGSIVLLTAISILQGAGILETIRIAVTLTVSAIPEHLTMILTITLTVGVARILRRRGVVRQLHSVETLGEATVICTDKTGTLTKGEMTAVAFDFLQGTVLEEGQSPKENLHTLAYIGLLLASDAHAVSGKQEYIGSATERTALAFAEKVGFNQTSLRQQWKTYDSITFSPEWKYRVVLTGHPTQSRHMFFVTGAPDVLLEKSSYALNEHNEIVLLTHQHRQQLQQQMDVHADRGDRLFAVAVERFYKRHDITHTDIDGMLFLGVLIIRDPVREEVQGAIAEALSAGVQVKLVTGDHESTAKAVARAVGLTATPQVVCSGNELAQMNDTELNESIDKIVIFARITPLDKQRIIRILQNKGHVVAMTGDGVNDAVALKGADIGVAMGSGKDIAKDAADIVLLDDNFVTIVDAIKEGRIVRDNIRKVIAFLLATNAAEIMIFFVSIIMRLPLPLLAVQILWINLVTDGTSDIALSFEPEEKSVMRRRPENRHAPLFNKITIGQIIFSGLVMTIATTAIYASALYVFKLELNHARTHAFVFLSLASLLSVWTWRSLKKPLLQTAPWSNIWLPLSLIFSFGLQLIAIYVPWFQTFFNTVPLNIPEWIYLFVGAILTIFVIDLRKIVKNPVIHA